MPNVRCQLQRISQVFLEGGQRQAMGCVFPHNSGLTKSGTEGAELACPRSRSFLEPISFREPSAPTALA